MTDPVAARYRDLLVAAVRPHAAAPLLLSGGVDSGTLLAAALAVGARPACYAFALAGRVSRDLLMARRMTADWGLVLVEVSVPSDPAGIEADVRELVRLLGTSRKAAVQCAQPILHLARRLRADGYVEAVTGTGGVCEDNRKVHVLLARDGEEAARALRRKNLLDWRGSATGAMIRAAETQGVTLHQPFAEPALAEFQLALPYAEVNRPRQKGLALRAFPEFWRRGYWRHNSPLQIASGLREAHDALLGTALNRRGLRAVVGIYRDIEAGRA